MSLDTRRERAGQPTQHPLDLNEHVEHLLLNGFRDERQVEAQDRLALELTGGTHRDIDKRRNSRSPLLPHPSATLAQMDTLARLICAFSSNSSLPGKSAVNS